MILGTKPLYLLFDGDELVSVGATRALLADARALHESACRRAGRAPRFRIVRQAGVHPHWLRPGPVERALLGGVMERAA